MLTVPLQQQEQGTLNVQCAKRDRSCPQMDDCSTKKFNLSFWLNLSLKHSSLHEDCISSDREDTSGEDRGPFVCRIIDC